ncbi:MAG: DUF1152 domain-containing protein [Opitutales bacterium]
MPETVELKKSLIELALESKRALILGIGGGGDAVQGIPIARLLRQLGVEEVGMGGVSCQWWTPEGNPLAEKWGSAVMGPTVYSLDDLSPAERVHDQVAIINSSSKVGERAPCEAIIYDILPADYVCVVGLENGVVGLRDSLQAFVTERKIDLVIGVDIGSDTFTDGKEAAPAKTAMVDFSVMSALMQLDVPSVYGVSGYGCDGEMHLEELDVRVARVMKAGGFIGAHGITQQDAVLMEQACERYGDPVEPMSYKAARGEIGLHNVWTHGPHGTVVKVTPLGAVMMLFDAKTLAESNSRGILALKETESLSEIEAVFKEALQQLPESRMRPVIDFFE